MEEGGGESRTSPILMQSICGREGRKSIFWRGVMSFRALMAAYRKRITQTLTLFVTISYSPNAHRIPPETRKLRATCRYSDVLKADIGGSSR